MSYIMSSKNCQMTEDRWQRTENRRQKTEDSGQKTDLNRHSCCRRFRVWPSLCPAFCRFAGTCSAASCVVVWRQL